MKAFLLLSLFGIVVWLLAEARLAAMRRRTFKHVIHVNGTRGKSGVARLIAAGMSAGGFRTFCKTTGTLPMTIDPDGNEKLIRRLGKANISEQLKTMKAASRAGAEVLVIECMAVDPELQAVCEHKMLKSDIGVITNVRIDHVAEMGDTLQDVCDALCGTVPENGIVFTADPDAFGRIQAAAARLGSRAVLAYQNEKVPQGEWFPENVALALAVCKQAGVEEDTALRGMGRVIADPFAVCCSRLPGGAVFLDGMSANDPQSTGLILQRFRQRSSQSFSRTVAVLNCRPDRGYRTNLMTDWILQARPDETWLIGRGKEAACRSLKGRGYAGARVFRTVDELPLRQAGEGTLVYAIGNIAGPGLQLSQMVKKEGEPYVW